MFSRTKIEWTESTWNPITGCTKISEGCKNCYAYKMALRLKAMGNKKYKNGFDLTVHEDVFNEPLNNKKPSLLFVNSMSDLFHEKLDIEIIKKLFDVMNRASWHTFQILTKRADILHDYSKYLNWSDNIWMGVTVESGKYLERIDYLRKTGAAIKFVSFEPLLGNIDDIDFKNIDWAIVGGESGVGARPLKQEWVLNIKKQCDRQNVLFYFKQWGGKNKKKAGRMLLNKTWDDMPVIKEADI